MMKSIVRCSKTPEKKNERERNTAAAACFIYFTYSRKVQTTYAAVAHIKQLVIPQLTPEKMKKKHSNDKTDELENAWAKDPC